MELLLLKDVEGLGSSGDIVTVTRGYARNYLFPRGLVKVPSSEAIEEVRQRSEKEAAEKKAVKAERMAQAKDLASVSVLISMKVGKGGHLYGSVGTRQIVDVLSKEGYDLEEKQIQLDLPLKKIGEYDVSVFLHPEVAVPVKVVIVGEED